MWRLAVNILGSTLTVNEVTRAGAGGRRADLTNFEIQKYQNEPKFTGVSLRNNISKIKNRAYIINLD